VSKDDDRDAIKAIFEQKGPQGHKGPAPGPQAIPPPDAPDRPRASGANVASGRRTFPDISPRAYEHPTDRAALATLRKIPGFDELVRRFFSFVTDKRLRLLYLANAVRVDETQFSRVNVLFEECLEILDYGERPELFITQTPLVNAGAVGVDKPFIVLNSGLLELMDDDELRSVLGHELGHALSGHSLYRTMLMVMLMFMGRIAAPLLRAASAPILIALREWFRKSELSADRAGLLCVQDPAAAYRVEMKLAGGNFPGEMSVDAFVKQAEEFEREGDTSDALMKLMMMLDRTHPFPVTRLRELKRWVDSGEYDRIMSGIYPRRSEDNSARVYDDVTAGAVAARQRLSDGDDALSRFVSELGNTINDLGAAVRDQVKDMFGKGDATPDDDAPADPPADAPDAQDPPPNRPRREL
jgi:Zn-dependent protease with chaperone function